MSILELKDLPRYTYKDLARWEGRWELIEGFAYNMAAMPMVMHQRVSGKIQRILEEELEECPKCFPLLPVDWKIDEETVVVPDNLVVCYEPSGAYITKAPTLIFEVLSNGNTHHDTNVKFKIYEREGVKYYCIVHPDDKVAKIYELKDGRYAKLKDTSDEKIGFDLDGCRMEFDFSRIWGK